MTTAHINIGSNSGHRRRNISAAVRLLQHLLGPVTARSEAISSAPWGFHSTARFLNIGVNVATSLPPDRIVDILRQIEHTIDPGGKHRNPDGTYADRAIDLDLIALGPTVSTLPHATVPHPRLHLRPFVLIPLARLMPNWHHPLSGLTPAQMLRNLRNNDAPASVTQINNLAKP